MSRRMKEKEDAGSAGASIARASGKLRNIFGKVQWRRKVATLLAAAMMTGTISDGLSMANLTGAGTVYASSSNAQREEDPGGQPVRKGDSASDYYLEEAKEDLDLQLNAASLKAAMESEEPIQLDLQSLPFEDEAVLVGAYDEIISKTEGYRLLEQGVLQDDEGKVTYLVFGKEGEKSSSWMDNLKVIVLNGNQQTEENPGYNISFTIEGDDLTLTEGQVEIRTFPSAVREEQENAPAVSAPSGNAGNAQPSGGGSGLESSDSEEETTAAETEAAAEEETTAVETGATAVEEETTAAETEAAAEEETTAVETGATAVEEETTAAETEAAAEEETTAAETEAAAEEETTAAETEAAAEEETTAAETEAAAEEETTAAETEAAAEEETTAAETEAAAEEETETAAEKETEAAAEEETEAAAEKETEAASEKETEAAESNETNLSWNPSGSQLSISRYTIWNVTATASNAKRREFTGDAESTIADIRQALSDSGRGAAAPTAEGKYTFTSEEVDAINMVESDSGISLFSLLGAFGGSGEVRNTIVSPGYSISYLSGQTRSTGPLDYAEQLYGNKVLGDELEYPVMAVSPYVVWADGSRPENVEKSMKAGEFFQLYFEMAAKPAATYGYNGDDYQPLYDQVESSWIYFWLPEGMVPEGNNIEGIKTENSQTLYRVTNGKSIATSGGETFHISVHLEGNGTLAAGEDFPINLEAWSESIINAIDRTTGDTKKFTVQEYCMEYSLDVQSEVDEKWGISKELIKAAGQKEWTKVTGSDGKDYVQLQYKLNVGLLNQGKIVSDSSYYWEEGRTTFTEFSVEDTITVTGKTDLMPSSVTAVMGEDQDAGLSWNQGTNTFTLTKYMKQGFEEASGNPAVAAEAPAYTTYTITVTYPYEEFLLAYDEFDKLEKEGNKDTYLVTNNAELTYTLNGLSQERAKADPVETVVRDRIDPVVLRIEKKIQNASNGAYEPYTTAKQANHPGQAVFTIEYAEKGTGDYQPYEKINFVKNYSGSVVMVNPEKDSSDKHNDYETKDDGYVAIYLEPGYDYRITEDRAPENTMVAAAQTVTSEDIAAALENNTSITLTFNNELSGQGGIKFRKGARTIGANGTETKAKALKGIQFGLFRADETEFTVEKAVQTATSDASGYVTFYPVEASQDGGTQYIVREVGNEGKNYYQDPTSYPVTVESGEIATLNVTEKDPDNEELAQLYNEINNASVTLTKLLQDDNGVAQAVPSGRRGEFSKAFQLQKNDNGSWENVGTAQSLTTSGTDARITWESIQRRDQVTGEYIFYRIVETLPDGYSVAESGNLVDSEAATTYHLDENENQVAIEFTFEPGSDKKLKNTAVTLVNTGTGRLTVSKEVWDYSSTAASITKATNAAGYTIGLFTKEGTGYTLVDTAETSAGKAQFTGLPVFDENRQKKNYYLGELNDDKMSGYLLYGKTTDIQAAPLVTVGQEQYYILDTPVTLSTTTTKTSTIYNVQQKIPYWITKTDSKGNYLSGASVTVKLGEETVAENQNVPSGGKYLLLDMGKGYTAEETKVPTNYLKADPISFTTPSVTITPANMQTILSQKKVGETSLVSTIVNKRKPQAGITKLNQDGKQIEVTFTVYRKTDDGSFESAAKTITTSASGTSKITLDPGTYYFRENVSAAYMNPDKMTDEQLNAAVTGQIDGAAAPGWERDAEDQVYFGPYELKEDDDAASLFTLTNKANSGRILATKVRPSDNSGSTVLMEGAEFTLTWSEGGEEKTKTFISTASEKAVTGDDGKSYNVVFDNLKVRDTDGEKITYTLTETKAPDGYEKSEKSFTIQLTEEKDTAQAQDGTSLNWINVPLVHLSVSKTWTDKWQEMFARDGKPASYYLPGVEIALFRVPRDASSDTPAEYVAKTTTDADGAAIFRSVPWGDENGNAYTYYMAEVQLPASPEGLVMPNGAVPLPGGYESAGTENSTVTITKGELNRTYNAVSINPEPNNESSVIQGGQGRTDARILDNPKPYLRFDVLKLCAWENTAEVTEDEHYAQHKADVQEMLAEGEDWTAKYEYIDGRYYEKVNGAKFALYSIAADQYDESAINAADIKANWTLVNTYESGAVATNDGSASGHIITEPVERGLVYALVETAAAPGYQMPDQPVMMIFYPDGSGINVSQDGPQGVAYDPVNGGTYPGEQDFIQNPHAVGGGGGIYYANLKFNKWSVPQESIDDPTEYKPLGSARFDLYLLDKNDNRVTVRYNGEEIPIILQKDIITGLENNPAVSSDERTANALSRTINVAAPYQDLNRTAAEVNAINALLQEYIQTGTDDQGEYKEIRVELVETYAPNGYNTERESYITTLRAYKNAWNLITQEGNVNREYFYEYDPETGEAILNSFYVDVEVVFNDYGFRPDSGDVGQTLTNAAAGAVTAPISGGRYLLERYDSASQEFVPYEAAGEDGIFTITDGTAAMGLKTGQYRLTELSAANGYQMSYDGDAAMIFNVGYSKKIIDLYHPEKPDLTVIKETWKNDSDVDLSGITFTLKKGSDSLKAVTKAENGRYQAEFADLESGTYTLSAETLPADSPVTDAYFTAQTVHAGYTYTYSAEDGEKVFGELAEGKGIFMAPELTVRNPRRGDLTIQKSDPERSGATFASVTFKVEYQKFAENAQGDGYDTVTKPASWTGTNVKTETVTITNESSRTLEGRDPGWYRITETTAPDGYTKSKEPVVVALTADMGTTNEFTERVVIENRKQVSFTLTKKLDFGSLRAEEQEAAVKALNGFTFAVYEGSWDASTLTLSSPVKKASLTVQNFTKAGDTYQASSTINLDQLADGKVYAIRETQVNGWTLLPKINGADATTATVGNARYLILDELDFNQSKTDLRVTVENRYDKGTIVITKVDAANQTKLLSGAEFTLYDAAGTTKIGTFNEILNDAGEGTGEYAITVPASAEGTAYIIKETKAPENYVNTVPETGISVTVTPGATVTKDTNSALQITNLSGIDLVIKKYGEEKEKATETNTLSGASFTLYRKEKAGTDWTKVGTYTTGASGTVSVAGLDVANYDYAVSENPVSQYSRYKLDSMEIGVAQSDEFTPIDLTGEAPYSLGSLTAGNRYQLNVYNAKPEILSISKTWEDGRTDSKAYVTVYNTNDTPADTTDDTAEYTDLELTASAVAVALQPGTYRIVETRVEGSDGYVLNPDDAGREEIVELENGVGTKSVALVNEKPDMELTLTKDSETAGLGNLWWQEADVTYTVAPSVTNSLPLTSYQLTESGLTMWIADGSGQKEITDSTPEYAQYVKNRYSITSIELDQVTDNLTGDPYGTGNLKGAECSLNTITASVTAYDFDGNPVGEAATVPVSSADVTARTVTFGSTPKIKYVTVSYEDITLKNSGINTGKEDGQKYVLGANFHPGSMKVTVHLDQQNAKDSEGAYLQQIEKVTNKAAAEMHYMLPDGEGVLTADSDSAVAVKDIRITEQAAPVVSFDKAVDKPTGVNPNSTEDKLVTYTLRLHNTKTEGETGLALENPIVIDALPLGMNYLGYTAEVTKYADGSEGESELTEGTAVNLVDPDSGRRNIVISFAGDLLPGEVLTVTLKTEVTGQALAYGYTLQNLAYATSGKTLQATGTNPYGASFKVTNASETDWAKEGLSGKEEILDTVKEASYGSNGYIRAQANSSMYLSDALYPFKEARGNRDSLFQTGTSTVTMITQEEGEQPADNGQVEFRLNLLNGSSDTDVTQLRVIDVIPDVNEINGEGTVRGSAFALQMTGKPAITMMGGTDLPAGTIVQYYVTTEAYTADHVDAVKDYLAYTAGNPGTGWTIADGNTDWTEVRAFIADIQNTQIKGTMNGASEGEGVQITYMTKIDPEMNLTEKNEVAFKLAQNDFTIQYKGRPSSNPSGEEAAVKLPRTSAKIYVKLLPTTVSVGGNVWIDADGDGRQDESSTATSETNLFNQMKDTLSISLNKYRGSTYDTVTANGDAEAYPDAYFNRAVYAQNKFRFSDLEPALPQTGKTLYDGDGNLVVNALTGADPATYELLVQTSSLPASLAGITLKLTAPVLDEAGKVNIRGHYSLDPRESAGGNAITDQERYDSNFEGNYGSSATRRFFLWSTTADLTDMTKDIGFVPYRDSFTIEKKDEAGHPLEGVSFTIYGPFAPGTAGSKTAADLNTANTVWSGETDGNGRIVLDDQLLYLMDYIIVEDEALDGYTLDDAEADGFDPISISGKTGWILPAGTVSESGTQDAEGNALYQPKITVINSYEKGSLKLAKVDSTDADEMLAGAKFTLEATPVTENGVADSTFAGSAAEFVAKVNNDTSWQTAAGVSGVTASSTTDKLTMEFTLDSGSADFGQILPRGRYTLTETKAPAGYTVDSTSKSFTIDKDGDQADFTGNAAIQNTPQRFALQKITEENGEPLRGATFNLYRAEDTGKTDPLWGPDGMTTNDDGLITFTMTGLSANTDYVLSETAAPSGYALLGSDIPFKLVPEPEGSSKLKAELTSPVPGVALDEDKNIVTIEVTNQLNTGSITLSKELIGEVTDPISGYGDTFTFTLKLEQPSGYRNPVLKSAHVTDGQGNLTHVNAVKTSQSGTTNLELPIGADGTVTGIQLKKGESLTISGIYYGTEYTVTEDQGVSTGFAFAGAVVQNGTDAAQPVTSHPVTGITVTGKDVSITIQNQVKKATVTLTKTFDSDIPGTMPTFQIYDITSHAAAPYASADAAVEAEKVTGGVITITWDDEKKEGTGTSKPVLIPGHTYQIVEILDPNDAVSAGYTAKVSDAITVTVGSNNVLVVDPSGVEMENNRSKGWISVSKILKDYDGNTISEERTFYYSIFRVENGGETAIDLGSHKIDAEHPTIGAIINNAQAHVHFVDFGTYRIAEVDEAGNKVTTASSLEYQVTNPADIVVELDKEANNTFSGEIVNQEKPLGSITVTKKADYARAETSFYFLVEDESGRYIDMYGQRQTDKPDAIWTITADQAVSYNNGDMVEIDSLTVTGIPYGTYTVTEVDASGNALSPNYAYTPSYTVKVGNGAEGSGNAGTINLTDSSMTVTVSNTVGRVDLEIVKTFDDKVPEDGNLPSFAVYHIEDVDDPITSAEDAESMTSVGTMEIRNENGTYKGSLTGQLIPGYSYQAVEILKTDEISKLYDPWISEVFTADENGDGIILAVKELTAENERRRGYLQVKKTLENVYGEITGTGRTFYYIVQDADGNAIDLPEGYRADMTNKNVGMITANAGTAQVIPVEFGTYTVYETDKSGNVYDTNNPNPAYEVTNPDPVTIGLNNADVTDPGTLVEIKNTEKNLGELTVTKETDYADAGSSFYFLVEDGRGQYLKTDGTLVPKASLASASEAVWTIEAEDAVGYEPDAQNEGHGVLQTIGSITVEEIPYGTYTVTEVDETGSKLGESFAYEVSAETTGAVPGTADGGTGEIDLDHPSMTVTVTNRVKKTHLTIEKIFDSHVPDAENLPEFAIYQLADADTPITSAEDVGSGNVQVATMSIASRSDATYGGETGDILIPGYSYQAVEILKKDEISRLYDPIVSDVMTVTLEPDGAAVNALSWTAENIRNYGYLTVTKELFDHYGEAIDDTRTFYYRIRDVKNGGYLTIEPEYRPNAELTEVAEITTAEGDQNIHFVKYGTYEIVETDENGNVYDVSESWLSGLLGKEANPIYIVENPDAVEINLNNADTASASIANRERALGELTIIKETDWAERGQTEFYFTVKNEGTGELLDAPVSGLGILANLFKSEEARKIWTITADRTTDTMAEVGRLTIGELPYGIYTVTEVDQNGDALDEYPYTVSYQVEVSGKDAVSSAEEGQGELDYQHPSMTVTVTNTRNKGYLTVRKNLQDYQGNTLTGTGRQFYFTVLDEDGNAVELPEEFRYEGQQYVGWITDNTSRELFLPYGTYRVLETDEEGQPYDAQNENLLYEVTTPGAVELSLANADSAEAVIVNKEKTIGSLTVTKRVNRTANGTTFYFIVTNSKGERMPMPDENGNPTEETIWRISASQNVMTDTAIGSLTLKNLPYDTYTVTEVRENGEALADSYIYNVSYETTAQGVTASGQSGTITIDARDMAVTVTNTRKTGGGSGDGDGGGGGGSDGGGGGSTITVTTDVPTASITDPGIPLSPYPGDGSVIIPEGEVPLFGLPKTGDNSISAAGLAGIMLAALLSACGIIRKRKKEEES